MSTLRAVSLGMGVLSLVAAVVAAFAVWLMFTFAPPLANERIKLSLAKSIATASCESLQKVCPLLAADADLSSAAIASLYRQYEKLFYLALFGTLGWGLLSGVCFLYIYAKAKQPSNG